MTSAAAGNRSLTTDDIIESARWFEQVAELVAADDWDVEPADGSWSPERIADHVANCMLHYSGQVAVRATGVIHAPRIGGYVESIEALIEIVGTNATILVRVLDDLPEGELAFHPSGMADRSGWVGMACTELLMHARDIGVLTGVELPGQPSELAAAVIGRIFPWAPDGDGWSQLEWATGRASLDGTPPAGPDWPWHPAPLGDD